jgi:hypothetical protein
MCHHAYHSRPVSRNRLLVFAKFLASVLCVFMWVSNAMVNGQSAPIIDAQESKKLSRQFLKKNHSALYEKLADGEPTVKLITDSGRVWRVQYMLNPRAKGNWIYVDIDAVSGKAHLLAGK